MEVAERIYTKRCEGTTGKIFVDDMGLFMFLDTMLQDELKLTLPKCKRDL